MESTEDYDRFDSVNAIVHKLRTDTLKRFEGYFVVYHRLTPYGEL